MFWVSASEYRYSDC